MVKEESCDENNMVQPIQEIIPEAVLQPLLTDQIVINLPNENTDKFPNLFKMLEEKRQEFCIKAMGISCTTMEEVFLK